MFNLTKRNYATCFLVDICIFLLIGYGIFLYGNNVFLWMFFTAVFIGWIFCAVFTWRQVKK